MVLGVPAVPYLLPPPGGWWAMSVEWEFPLAGKPEDVRAPRCDDSVPPEKRVEARILDDGTVELGTDNGDEWMTSTHPVISTYQYR